MQDLRALDTQDRTRALFHTCARNSRAVSVFEREYSNVPLDPETVFFEWLATSTTSVSTSKNSQSPGMSKAELKYEQKLGALSSTNVSCFPEISNFVHCASSSLC